MQYVHVLDITRIGKGQFDVVPSILIHTNHLLISLYEAFKSNSLRDESVTRFYNSAIDMSSMYASLCPKIWVDSGGFSFISGKISVANVDRMIRLYCIFLERYSASFHRIFSLDLPFHGADESFNNSSSVFKANSKSLAASKAVIADSITARERFIYVMQFLRGDSLRIWSRIYKEHGLGDIVQNRAIGGMVGVRKWTKNLASPFVAIAFKAYVDFICSQGVSKSNSFNLHLLGINSTHDRFLIAFLEQLFADYLSPNGVIANLSYDTSRFSAKARRANKTNSAFIVGTRLGLYYVPGYNNIHPSKLTSVYEDDLIDIAEENLNKWNNGERVDDTAIFEPINVHSQMAIDKIYYKTIEKYKIIDALYHTHTEEKFERYLDSLLSAMSHGHELAPEQSADSSVLIEATLFDDDHFKVCTKKNLLEVYRLHKWFSKPNNSFSGIDRVVQNFTDRWHAAHAESPSCFKKKE